MNYIHQTLHRNRSILDNADVEDIKRIAFVGDRLIATAVCLNLSRLNEKNCEWDSLLISIVSNKNLSKSFIGPPTKLIGSDTNWNNATYIEACFYLDHQNFGMEFLVKGAANIPFRKIRIYPKKGELSITPRYLKAKESLTYHSPEFLNLE